LCALRRGGSCRGDLRRAHLGGRLRDRSQRNRNRVGIETNSRRYVFGIGGGEHDLHGLRLMIPERELNHEGSRGPHGELAGRATARSPADLGLRPGWHAFHRERHRSDGGLGVRRQCRRRDAASGHASSPQQCHGKGAGSAQAQGRAMPPVEVRAEIVPWNAMPFVRASTHDRKVSRLPTRIPFPTLRTFHTTAARRISSRGLPYSPQTTRKCNTKAERSSAKFVYYPVSHHGSVCSKPRPFRIFAFPLVSCSSIVYQRFAWVQTGLGQCHEASTASHQQK